MSSKARATIRSTIVKINKIIPASQSDHNFENKYPQELLPWVFLTFDTASPANLRLWPRFDHKFDYFFACLDDYQSQLEDFEESGVVIEGISSALVELQTVSLPKKSWKVPESRTGWFAGLQSDLLYLLLNGVHKNMEGLMMIEEERFRLRFCRLLLTTKYVVDGERFSVRSRGGVVIYRSYQPRHCVPLISFTSWFENQTWAEFLIETLTVMLGQLSRNMGMVDGVQAGGSQEVFVVGLYGPHFHIAHGSFTAETIARVQSKGCSESDVFELEFSRGYDLSLKSDWVEFTGGLARLFRYLWSGRADVTAMRTVLEFKAKEEGIGT